MRQSGYLQAEQAKRRALLDRCQHIERQRCMDCFQVALRRKGFSYARIKSLTEAWMDVVEEFAGAFQGGTCAEADYLRERLDTALSEFISPHQEFVPFELRYPDLKGLDPVTGKLSK